MKKLLLITAFIFIGFSSTSAQENHTITLDFKGMKSNNGNLYVALYNKEDSFLKNPIKATILKIENKKASVILKDIPSGIYAVSAFHDANNNKKMDTNFIGIPKEPIGISNDAKGFMGPPKYKDAKFEVSKDTELTIIVK
ncbi:Uncharacterized conserved protein, DUF2141 family [Polaribacter sp. KT25b]|uniref:DUF2141 domain-containing protein n=1 Tax=Polaribacter sp. KT25b TaxID=1855336 RepID=UPI00087A4EE7|nr:DUF2141 domain-containing protein [Polaribacter sp. KT25b]SDR75371.1 Uncharacterized conserved protein, DUF2141 family [Polaribacter sp. KT25b]